MKLMCGDRSDATNRALAGAPHKKKDLRLNVVSGMAEARKLRDRVSALMVNAQAEPEDAAVFIVVANPDLSGGLDARQLSLTNGASDLALANLLGNKLPIGFLVFVMDKSDEKRPVFGHARPLIVKDPGALDMMERALRTAVNSIVHPPRIQ
jgi:hypothetical protein